MQIRCTHCTKTIAIGAAGAVPALCPHCHEPPLPARLGEWEPERLLATGGMGEVYLAHHAELGTKVAIKLLPAMPLAAIPALRQRFAREARLTAKVRHPGVVRVLHSDASGDRPFLVLEFVDGETLRQRLAKGPLPVVDAVRIAAAIADVLAAAHAEGVLHRDVKPDNVMLVHGGGVRVLDFGIARAVSDDAPLTRTGEIVGTPEYMAPEQLLDGPEATDARTDVHALGVLLYELVTGSSPFRGANVFQALKLVESLVPEPASARARDVPPALDAAIARALQKHPADRFASAAEFAAVLRAAVPAARVPAAVPRPSRARTWTQVAVIALCGAAMPIIGWRIATATPASGPGEPAPARDTDDRAARRAAASADLAAGLWARAQTAAIRALAEGDAAARPLAREAFVLAHAAWPRACGLPAWLGAADVRMRDRLFGDVLEPGDRSIAPFEALLRGDDDTWREWLEQPDASPAARRLLPIASLPPAERAAAFADHAAHLPIEEPEHWLARTAERHLRGDRAGALQAAELAWLSGAGELAVLLDAALAAGLAAVENGREAPPPLADDDADRLRRRVAAADPDDCPASTLLALWLAAPHDGGQPPAPAPARRMPAPDRADAAAWFVTAAGAGGERARGPLLRVAAALGAAPDFAAAPWRDLPSDVRQAIEREVRRDH